MMRLPLLLPSAILFSIAIARNAVTAKGGSFCGTMACVSGTISGPETIYTIHTATSDSPNIGWVAVGFGQRIVGSQMVVIWANDDGNLVLSQRQATTHGELKVPPNPPRVATLRPDLSSLAGSPIKLAFSMLSSGESVENLIYALGEVNPLEGNISSISKEHYIAESFTLNLSGKVADTYLASGSSTSSTILVPRANGSRPYTTIEKKLLAHGILSALGFCFFLPIGVLQARFLRIWWLTWFKTHWIAQAGLAGPFIIAGSALAVNLVQEAGIPHFYNTHTRIGLVLFLLYICQGFYGLVIHLIKNPRRRRPIQNYGHAILGLGIISLSLYQVWLGFTHEWPFITRRDVSKGWRAFWIFWIAFLGSAYFIGLALLPKQYRTERDAVQDEDKKTEGTGEAHPMNTRST